MKGIKCCRSCCYILSARKYALCCLWVVEDGCFCCSFWSQAVVTRHSDHKMRACPNGICEWGEEASVHISGCGTLPSLGCHLQTLLRLACHCSPLPMPTGAVPRHIAIYDAFVHAHTEEHLTPFWPINMLSLTLPSYTVLHLQETHFKMNQGCSILDCYWQHLLMSKHGIMMFFGKQAVTD